MTRTKTRRPITVFSILLVTVLLTGYFGAQLISPAQASSAAGVPVIGLDCASGTFETPSDGVHDTACTWSGNVDADVDGINDPLISDSAPPNGGGGWVS